MKEMNKILNLLNKFENSNKIKIISPIKGIVLGGALCCAIESKNYSHIPVICIMPSIYSGYQLYKNKNAIILWFKNDN